MVYSYILSLIFQATEQHVEEAVKATEEDMDQLQEEFDDEFQRLLADLGSNYMPYDKVHFCSIISC